MDLIGREVAKTVADIHRTIMHATQTQAVRSKKVLFWLSVTLAIGTSVVLLASPLPVPDRFGFSMPQQLWFNESWQRWSGYVLLAFSGVVLGAGVVVSNRLVSSVVAMRRWRISHIAIDSACLLTLFAQTGFRRGGNLNLLLMGSYLSTLGLGAVTGITVGSDRRLE